MSFSTKWNELIGAVAETVARSGVLFFRGQEQQEWGLVPAIGRIDCGSEDERNVREARLFYDFKIHAGNLLENEDDSWRVAFLMQHHGLPTRLLDWSASFAIALHFAMRHAREHDAVVWVLDVSKLNLEFARTDALVMHSDLPDDYHAYFIARRAKFPFRVVGLAPSRSSPRLQQQRGFFTLHGDLSTGLEEMHAAALTKVVIPRALFEDARAFLRLSGVNEFSLFPDLDGLSRHLRVTHGLVRGD
jgi:hypothetical protein